MPTHGLGYIESPPDALDFPIADLFTAKGVTPDASPPASFRIKVLPPVFDQGNSPMCVAFSSSTLKGAEDLLDQKHNYLWDRNSFFRKIGGTQYGAMIRNALDRMLKVGYPLLPEGSGNSQAAHRISAYYAIPKTKLAIQQAIQAFGVCLMGTPWFNSWFTPHADGTLPPADYQVGGHAIAIIGWTSKGLVLRNSWGKDWGVDGDCIMPWSFVLSVGREFWKAVDVIDT